MNLAVLLSCSLLFFFVVTESAVGFNANAGCRECWVCEVGQHVSRTAWNTVCCYSLRETVSITQWYAERVGGVVWWVVEARLNVQVEYRVAAPPKVRGVHPRQPARAPRLSSEDRHVK